MPVIASVRRDLQVRAIQFLQKLGFEFVGSERVMLERDGEEPQPFLRRTLRRQFGSLNGSGLTSLGGDPAEWLFARGVREVVDCSVGDLQRQSERIYQSLFGNQAAWMRPNLDGGEENWCFIDCLQPERNTFQVASNYFVKDNAASSDCCADLVLFINGIPLVMVSVAEGVEEGQLELDLSHGLSGRSSIARGLRPWCQIQVKLFRDRVCYGAVGCDAADWLTWKEDGNEDAAFQAVAQRYPKREDHLALFHSEFAPLREVFERRSGLENASSPLESFLWSFGRPTRLLERLRFGLVLDRHSGRQVLADSHQLRIVRQVQKSLRRSTGRTSKRALLLPYIELRGRSHSIRLLGKVLALSEDLNTRVVLFVTESKSLRVAFYETVMSCGRKVTHATRADQVAKVSTEDAVPFVTVSPGGMLRFMAVHPLSGDDNRQFVVVIAGCRRRSLVSVLSEGSRLFTKAPIMALVEWPVLKDQTHSLRGFVRRSIRENPMVSLLREGLAVPVGIETAPLQRCWFPDDEGEHWVSRALSDARLRWRVFKASDVAARWGPHDMTLKACAWNLSRHFDLLSGGAKLGGIVVVPSEAMAQGLFECIQAIDLVRVVRLSAASTGLADEEGASSEQTSADFNQLGHGNLVLVERSQLEAVTLPVAGIVYYLGDDRNFPFREVLMLVNRNTPGKRLGLIVHLSLRSEESLDHDALNRAAKQWFGAQLPSSALGPIECSRDNLLRKHCKLWALLGGSEVRAQEAMVENRLMENSRFTEFAAALVEFRSALWKAYASPRWVSGMPHESRLEFCRDLFWFERLLQRMTLRRNDESRFFGPELRWEHLLGDDFRLNRQWRRRAGEDSLNGESLEEDLAEMISDEARADLLLNRIRGCLVDRLDDAPFFCRRMLDRVDALFNRFLQNEINADRYLCEARALLTDYLRERSLELGSNVHDSELLKALKDAVRQTLVNQTRADEQDPDWRLADVSAWYQVSAESTVAIERDAAEIVVEVLNRVTQLQIVNWTTNVDVQNRMRNQIDDFLSEWMQARGRTISAASGDALIESVLSICRDQMGPRCPI